VRILYFSRDYTPHDFRFLSSLAETSHEIFYLRLERNSPLLEDRVLPKNIKQLSLNVGDQKFSYGNIIAYRRKLKQIILELKPDIIHAGPIQTCAFLVSTTGFKPLVTMSWGSDILKESQKNKLLKWITKFTLDRSTVLLGDCDAVREKSIEFGFPVDHFVQFPWGVDLNQFSPARNNSFRERRGWQENFVILSLRSWEPIYGVDVVAKAFSLAAKEVPDLRLILLGNGSQASLIRSIIENEGVSDKVFFGGQVTQKDLPVYYQSSDLYISASQSDGSSVSLMEAMACGIPPLVSDIPGNREWIIPDHNGWLFPNGDVLNLRDQILNIYKIRNDLQEISLNTRQQAEQKADWTRNFKELLFGYQLAKKITHG
jgi:glycosyltransferase involved in cell wall biosynthesis